MEGMEVRRTTTKTDVPGVEGQGQEFILGIHVIGF